MHWPYNQAPFRISERYDAGLFNHSVIDDSRQPAQRVLILRLGGKVPSSILRYIVDRLSPVRARTAARRRMRSWACVCMISPCI